MYIVIELQSNLDGTLGNIITQHKSLAEAESKFHTILAAAALSNVYKHTAIILDDEGAEISARCFIHKPSEE